MRLHRDKSLVMAMSCVLVLAAVPVVTGMIPSSPAGAASWERLASRGMGIPANGSASAMAFFGGRLYVGTNNPEGCQVWSYDGMGWSQEVGGGAAGTPAGPGFGNAKSNNVSCMAVFHSKLYLGVRNAAGGCRLWSFDGVGWSQPVGGGNAGTAAAPGFGSDRNTDITSLAVFDGRLYAGTYNPDGCQVWSYDGKEWKKEAEGGFGDADNYAASSMASYMGRLYVGTYNNDYTSGCQVWSYDGEAWKQEVGGGTAGTPTAPGFGDPDNRRAASMAVYDSILYVGTYDSSGGQGCQVWSYDGANWKLVADKGFGSPANLSAASMVAGGLYLYVGTYNESTGCEVWRYDGTEWCQEGRGGLGYDRNTSAPALALRGGELVVGTQNLSGCQVWRAQPSSALYFAEGYTGPDFHEYLCLGNPQPVANRVSVTYLFPDGAALQRKVLVPAESRMTLNVNADVGPDREVSVQLECERDLAAERPMYFKYGGSWSGGHDVMGTPETSTIWYFAEGYTGPGFEEWICVLNPEESDAQITFYFQTQERGEVVKEGYSVPARSRGSFKVNELLGNDYQVSLKLVSSAPVVAERPMYFDYLGTAARHWKGGHCVMGATDLAQVYFFAEGTTRPGFEEWLTLQNPNPFRITVNASFQPGPDQGAGVERIYSIDPGRRFTVYVPGEAGPGKDVSVVLASTDFFLAERPMYFRYGDGGWEGGDCVIGARRAGKLWYLAEGYTGAGFHTWLCIMNPGPEDARVLVDYYTQEEGPLATRVLEVPSRRRLTVLVNQHAGEGYQLSTRLVSDQPLVVERPMYFDYMGLQGGHDVIGRLVR